MEDNLMTPVVPVTPSPTTPPIQISGEKNNKKLSAIITIVVLSLVLLFEIGYVFNDKVNFFGKLTVERGNKDLTPADMARPIKVGEAGYDYYLSKALPADVFASKGFVAASPAVVKLEDGFLTVGLPLVPNVNLSEDAIIVNFDSAKDKNGKELLDKESSFEQDTFFTHLSGMEIYSEPVVYLDGGRSMQLISQAKNSEVASVSGKIILNLPVDLYTAELTSKNIGKTIKTPNGSLTLKSMSTSADKDGDAITSIVFHYAGFKEKMYFAKAYSADDAQLDLSSQNFIIPSSFSGYENSDYTMKVYGTAQKFVFSESGSKIVRTIPFSISDVKNISQTGSNQ